MSDLEPQEGLSLDEVFARLEPLSLKELERLNGPVLLTYAAGRKIKNHDWRFVMIAKYRGHGNLHHRIEPTQVVAKSSERNDIESYVGKTIEAIDRELYRLLPGYWYELNKTR